MTLELDYPYCLNKDCSGRYERENDDGEVEIISPPLTYVALHDFWECPYCLYEVWTGVDKGRRKSGQVTDADAKWAYRDEHKRMNMLRAKKGSSSSSKNRSPKKVEVTPDYISGRREAYE